MKFDSWHISRPTIIATEVALQRGAHEVFVIWAGLRSQPSPACEVTQLIIPKQVPESTVFGVAVRIDGAELARIQFENFDRGERSYVQIHTHPGTNVEMSDLDRKREVVNHVGALSMMVPHYCANGLQTFRGVNVYEREQREWRLWSPDETNKRIRISE